MILSFLLALLAKFLDTKAKIHQALLFLSQKFSFKNAGQEQRYKSNNVGESRPSTRKILAKPLMSRIVQGEHGSFFNVGPTNQCRIFFLSTFQ